MHFKSKYDIPYGHSRELLTADVTGMGVLRPHFRDNCSFCGNCCMYCPTQSISVVNCQLHVNVRTCKGCGICARECTSKAIFMKVSGE